MFACEQTWGVGSSRKAPTCSHANKTSGCWKLLKGLACSHANKTSGSRKPQKGARVFACEQDLGESEAPERCSRVRMRTRLRGAGSSRKVFACEQDLVELEASERACVFACEQEPWLAFLSKWNFFLTASTIFMVGAVGADTSSFLAPSVSDSRFGFHPAWSHQSSLQASSLSCSGCPVAAVVPVSGSRSSAVSILRSSVVSGCRFFLVSVCRTID